MRKLILLIIIIIIVLASFRAVFFDSKKVCFENNCFIVEIADTDRERARGLMFRKDLDLEKGMLFVFDEEGKHSFWMKNMEFPIDIIWMNTDKEVVSIDKNVQPCIAEECRAILPEEKVRYVLELNSGMADKFSIQEEEIAVFQ